MAIITQPTFLPGAIAYGGDKNTIPLTNDGSQGFASIEKGFPGITEKPIAQGGLPPQRGDFNGLFNLLSQYILYQQNGGLYAYNPDFDYAPLQMVTYSDKLWLCKAQNGPSVPVGPQAPADGSEYWGELTLSGANRDLSNLTEEGESYIRQGVGIGWNGIVLTPNWEPLPDHPQIEKTTYQMPSSGWLAVYDVFCNRTSTSYGFGGYLLIQRIHPEWGNTPPTVQIPLGAGLPSEVYTAGLIYPVQKGTTVYIARNGAQLPSSPWENTYHAFWANS